ncbi:hypothetical protein [Parasphingorhabdus pacifica]
MIPQPLPPTSACAAGYAAESIADHESALVGLHESGSIRLIDTGGDGDHLMPRRWRMRWGRDSTAVRAMLGIARTAPGSGEFAFWLRAEAGRPWSIRDQRSPVERLGLLEHALKDPSAAFSLTQQNPLVGLDDVGFLEHTFNHGVRDNPVLVYNDHAHARFNHEMLRFRNATRGLCGLLPIDDSARNRLNELLPTERQVPRRAVRLYLPPWWVGHLEDVIVPVERLSRPAVWRRIVETVVHVGSWRPGGKVPATVETWQALMDDPMGDRRVVPATRGGNLHWQPVTADRGDQALRKRLHDGTEQTRQLRAETERVRTETADREATLRELRNQRDLAQRSRRRLAELTHRFRRERDAAEQALRGGAVAETWHRAREAELEVSLYAEELDRIETELHRLRSATASAVQHPDADEPESRSPAAPPGFANFEELLVAARGLDGLELGVRTRAASKLDGQRRTPQWLRRTWDVLELLDAYAHARRDPTDHGAPDLRGFAHYVREHGGDRGLSPTLVASGESEQVVNTPRFREARTFPVSVEVRSAGQAFFGAHVKIDRGGGVAPRLHYLDDTRGATGVVHVGYIGPHLPGPESN